MKSEKIAPSFLMIALLALLGCSASKEDCILTSPDGTISITVIETDSFPMYQVSVNGRVVVYPSNLGLELNRVGQDFISGLRLIDIEAEVIDEAYVMPSGKRKECVNFAHQKTFTFENLLGNKIQIVFRAYDDGVAFQYKLDSVSGDEVVREVSGFNLGAGCTAWVHEQTVNYEEKYKELNIEDLGAKQYIFPTLLKTPDDLWMLLTDAAVFDNYPAANFVQSGPGELLIHLPDHDNSEDAAADSSDIVIGQGFVSPWRAIIIGSELGLVVESILVQNLNPPSRIENESWIIPGVVAFPWWSDFFANDSKETMMKFVDLVEEMGWQYVEFDIGLIGNDGWRTSENWKEIGFIQEVIDYANSKGIGIIGWDERSASDTPEKRKTLYSLYKQMGVKGIKLDYLNGDKQKTMAYMAAAVSDAAEYGLMVSFHGCPTPKGMVRTYPNIMTYEAVRGAEYYQFYGADHPSPTHNTTLPFTRNLVGPMDYTPCSYSATNRTTTYAHETALPFIFESGWVCMADSPESYLNSPAKPLLKKINAAWDELRFMSGFPGRYCCLARRSGNDWVVAAINSGTAREIPLDLRFLGPGEYKGILYADGTDPEHTLQIDTFEIKPSTDLSIALEANGGFVLDVQRVDL